MEYRSLGRTGVKVSSICLGAMNFGGRADAAQSRSIIDAALDAGLNFIDTANVYGHDPADFNTGRGRSEAILGEALTGRRDQVVLTSKMYFPMSGQPGAMGPSRRNIIAECEASLKRLQTDYIDLYQLHHPSNDVPIDETLRALDDLIHAGKVRYIGTSSFSAWQIVESLWVSSERGLNRFVCEQPAYHLLDRRIERELVPMSRTYGIGLITWSPAAGGFLTGKYRPGQAPPDDSRFDVFWKGSGGSHFTDEAFAVLSVVEALAAEHDCTPYQIALAWVLAQPGISSAIIGPRTVAHLTGSLAALDVTLSADDLARLDQVAPPGRAIVPYYGYDGMTWVTWGPHQYRW